MNRHLAGVTMLAAFALPALSQAVAAGEAAKGPVKVFILASQSNMEGKGAMRLAEAQSEAPETKDFLIKTAWGGRSLGRDFLPPGAKQPTDDELRAMVEKENENNRKHKEAWDKVGSDRGYHYLGSARTFCRIGRAFGEAMVELLKTRRRRGEGG